MTRFVRILVCLVITKSLSALRIPQSLKDVAKRETMRNPLLRKQDSETQNTMNRNLARIAFTPRQLNNYQNANNGNADQQQNGAYNTYGYWDQYLQEEGFGFDITSYAVKYTQCSTVQTYSDELAESEYTDTVLAAQRFALFRLCPKDQCSSYSNNGCSRNYGEYLVSMDQFLLALLEYEESRVSGYCQYCQNCAAIEAAKHFWSTVYSTRDYALAQAKSSYQSWYTSYLEAYYTNTQSNANANNNADGQNANGDANQQVDTNIAAQRYYQQVRNSNNYANNYAKYNYYSNNQNQNQGQNANQYGAYGSQYQWSNQDMWQSQNNQQRQYSNQNTWSSMGSPTGSFYGKTILNGYYDGDGQFVQIFGYINNNYEYVSLEDDELAWDESLWGEESDGWADVTSETESCSYTYAGSCYNQYDACMQILEDADYLEYQEYQKYQQTYGSNNYNYQTAQQQQQQQQTAQQATLKDFLGCVQVDTTVQANQYYQGYYNQGNQQGNYKSQYGCYEGQEGCDQAQEYQENVYRYYQQQNENQLTFIGPFCGSNNRDISLAVYKDPYCSVRDETRTVQDVLGYDPNSETIDLVPDECMSCFNDQQQVWYEDEEIYMLEPMCSMLYQFAGKCNKNLDATEFNSAQYNSYVQYQQYQQAEAEAEEEGAQDENYAANQYNQANWKQMYQSQSQAANEEAVCEFISALTSNTYNENGEIEIQGFTWSPLAWEQEFLAESKAMNPALKSVLVLSVIAAASMAVVAFILHGTLARKNIPWKPRRSKGRDPTDLARQSSGITMGRSRSGPGSNPLL